MQNTKNSKMRDDEASEIRPYAKNGHPLLFINPTGK